MGKPADDYLAVAWHCGDGILCQPEDLQVAKLSQVVNLFQAFDQIAPDVELFQICALANILQRANAVDRDRQDFQGGHVTDDADVSQVIRTQIQVFDLVELISLCLEHNQLGCQGFGLMGHEFSVNRSIITVSPMMARIVNFFNGTFPIII